VQSTIKIKMNHNEKDFEFYFNHILTKGRKDNTYKFALARFLLDFSRDSDETHIKNAIKNNSKIIVKYSTIAKYFLKYYWHQECKYKIRQNPHLEKPPLVIQIIHKVFGKKYIPDLFRKMPPDKIRKAELEITKKCFSEVIPRFQTVSEGSKFSGKTIFYEYDGLEHEIHIVPEVLLFFKENYTLLLKAVLLEWAKFLEKLNTSLPRLISKIESDEIKRSSLTEYRKILEPYFKNCFYCDRKLEGQEVHVDHFIPWSYIFEDELWNFILSCRDCNCKKLGSLAPEAYVKKIIDRNRDYQNKIPELKKSLNILDSGKGWEKALNDHYENCNSYGFTVANIT